MTRSLRMRMAKDTIAVQRVRPAAQSVRTGLVEDPGVAGSRSYADAGAR
jgi:hypothetical protein